MKKRNKKIMSKVIAGGMLISNIPIQTFANEIENLILETSNIKEKIENEKIYNQEMENKDETEIMDSNILDNENKISKENNLEDYQIREENQELLDEKPTDIQENLANITIKEIETNKYIINTVDDLKQLRTEININHIDTTNLVVELGSDIDFTNETSWEPIASTTPFAGTFDGKNHTIKNINISNQFVGLFGNTFAPTFQNINFDNININTTNENSIGILFGTNTGGVANINNIHFLNTSIIAYKASYVGAVAGVMPNALSNISNISFEGEIISNNATIGGLIGMGSGNLSNIKVKGKIEGYRYVGGLIGLLNGPTNTISKIEDIDIDVSLESLTTLDYSSAGGVVGFAPSSVSINNVNIKGESISGYCTGGVIGQMSGSSSNKETLYQILRLKQKN